MSALRAEIEALIAAEGPIGIDRYMTLALAHPVHGYYVARDPLGAAGDFTTAPEISQMFGELLGLWAAVVWTGMGRPDRVSLVECGPGRGTLMRDALRAAASVPGFRSALLVHLVEISPVLRATQAETLRDSGAPVSWHASLDDVPEGPAIVLANEFLDALPIRQFVRRTTGWHERLVGLGPEGGLGFGLAAEPEPRLAGRAGEDGAVLELGLAAMEAIRTLSRRIARHGGAALLVDYGHAAGGFGDTFQAVRRHGFADPLADPGEADLTAHVDFSALAAVAASEGLLVHGPAEQGAFLEALGIRERAASLASASGRADEIAVSLARLTGRDRDGMGRLFKAMALSHPGLDALPGLPRRTAPDAAMLRTQSGDPPDAAATRPPC